MDHLVLGVLRAVRPPQGHTERKDGYEGGSVAAVRSPKGPTPGVTELARVQRNGYDLRNLAARAVEGTVILRVSFSMGVGEEQLGGKDLQVTAIMAMPTREILDELAQRVVEGNLRVPVQRSYSLEEVPQAIQDFAQGTLGKYGLRIVG